MKIGFIGCGNMASAIMGGIVKSKIIDKSEIIASDNNKLACEKIKDSLGVNIAENNCEVAKSSEVLVLAVKPHFYETVINEIKDVVKDNCVIISIAPGKTLAWLLSIFGGEKKIIRTMPNTPAMVGQGMTAVCPNEFVEKEEIDYVCSLLNSFGKAAVITEMMMDAVVGVSGSSPAYVCMFIEALADGAVMGGLPRNLAYEFAAQAVLGTAQMVLESGLHPAALKDMVCSPGGTTIEAVRVLEEKGMRSSVIEAMKVCMEKSKGM